VHKLPAVNSKQIIRVLNKPGYLFLRQSGSHARYALPDGLRPVTVAIHSTKTIPPKTLRAILRQIDISVEEF
jgi:predicted RNA binding protein YcfA (HicA-like mRNA interferase family)